MALIGKNEVLANLNKEIKKIKGRNKAGLADAAALIKARSMLKTPVDLDNLKPSHYVAEGGTDAKPIAEIGLTAEYAVIQHENLEFHHEVGEAKFLEKAVEESEKDILRIIRNKAKVE